MAKNKFKLIIWDFDGVIADTEKLWLINRQKLLNAEFGLDWDFATTNHYLGGMSDKTKKHVLDNLNIKTDDAFWDRAMAMDIKTMELGFEKTPGIENIFSLKEFKQCIATGGILTKTMKKIEIVKISPYFKNSQVFTADMVKHGKPEPDIFLLAATTMGEQPSDTVVIEDSLAGMTAALKAGMTPVAFIGCEMNNNPEYIAKIKALGVKYIFETMAELKNWLLCGKDS